MLRTDLRPALLAAILLVAPSACRCALPPFAEDDPAVRDARTAWKVLRSGLAYRHSTHLGATFHAIRVDLERFELRVADARRPGRRMADVEELGRESGAVAAINGTFFDERQRPLGLLVSQGSELNELRDVSWWAALVVRERNGRPAMELLPTSRLRALSGTERGALDFAMQVGPRTVVDGKPLKLKRQAAARSAACIVSSRELVLIATEGEPLESNALAAYMAEPASTGGYGCRYGVMLDGGPSTQLWIDGSEARVRGSWPVPNALVVMPRAPSAKTSAVQP